MGRPRSGKNQSFGAGVDLAMAMVQHQGAQLFADGRAARLPRPQHCVSGGFQPGLDGGCLGGLACPVAALERDEQPRAGASGGGNTGGSHPISVPSFAAAAES